MLKALGSRLTYANVMATVAVFLALGGGAYALTSIPDRGGVFHGCVSNATGVLRVVKSSRSCHRRVSRGSHRNPGEFAVSWNEQGPRGLQGSQGIQGVQGQKGATGQTGPPGPTTAAVQEDTSSFTGNPSASPTTGLQNTATITTTATSKLLISGFVPMQVVCGPSTCSEYWGLYLDGQPVPATRKGWQQGASSSSPIVPIDLAALTGALPAGTHTVSMKDDQAGSVGNTFQRNPRVSIVALGG